MQGQSLTAAETGRQHHAVEGLEAVTTDCLEQHLRLLGGEVTRIFALDGRAFDQGGRIALDQPVPDRDVKGGPEHGVDRSDG